MPDFFDPNDVRLNTIYGPGQAGGVIALIIASFISLIAVLSVGGLLAIKRRRGEHLFPNTHVAAYYTSLLVANGIQSIGSIFSIRWVALGGVHVGSLCVSQGGWKNAGNLSTALFSLLIAFHIFHTLFLRATNSRRVKWASIVFVWSAVMIIVFFGPVVLEPKGLKEGKGPYFGPSGLWCWITHEYKGAQTGAEYAFMFTSAFFAFLVYVLVFLKMRGNLVGRGLNTRFQWIRGSEAWKLNLGRDEVDAAMFQVVKRMIWYPVAYTILILPIALARFIAWFSDEHVPFQVTIFADFIFNLTGAVNAILLLLTRMMLPDNMGLPTFATRRKTLDLTTAKGLGVSPFILPPMESSTEKSPTLSESSANGRTPSESTSSMSSFSSDGSLAARRSDAFKIPRKPPLTVDIGVANRLGHVRPIRK